VPPAAACILDKPLYSCMWFPSLPPGVTVLVQLGLAESGHSRSQDLSVAVPVVSSNLFQILEAYLETQGVKNPEGSTFPPSGDVVSEHNRGWESLSQVPGPCLLPEICPEAMIRKAGNWV
jgi:hypothetical protein